MLQFWAAGMLNRWLAVLQMLGGNSLGLGIAPADLACKTTVGIASHDASSNYQA
jgi:hypothetical protein